MRQRNVDYSLSPFLVLLSPLPFPRVALQCLLLPFSSRPLRRPTGHRPKETLRAEKNFDQRACIKYPAPLSRSFGDSFSNPALHSVRLPPLPAPFRLLSIPRIADATGMPYYTLELWARSVVNI